MRDPVLRCSFGTDPKIAAQGRNEHAVVVFKAACGDAIDPDGKGFRKSRTCLLGGTNEINDHRAPRL